MTNEQLEKFLLKIIEQTKENKIQWSRSTIKDTIFVSNLQDEFKILIYKPDTGFYMFELKNKNNNEKVYEYSESSPVSKLIVRLWNFLDSIVLNSNPFDRFINEYVQEDRNQ